MELYAHPSGNAPVLVVSGRVTVEDAPTLKQQLTDALKEHSHTLIVDLSRVEFMGSAGLGALITAIKEARAAGGDVILAAPSSVAQTLLHVSGLLDFVTHTATVADAATHLAR